MSYPPVCDFRHVANFRTVMSDSAKPKTTNLQIFVRLKSTAARKSELIGCGSERNGYFRPFRLVNVPFAAARRSFFYGWMIRKRVGADFV